MLLHLHPKSQSTHSSQFPTLFSSILSSPLPTLFPHSSPVFSSLPHAPKSTPLPSIPSPNLPNHPNFPHSNHPFPPLNSPHPIILPVFTSNSIPGLAPNHPKYVNTIPHSPLTAKTILDFSPKIVYNIRISTSKMLKYHHKINYFKGELSMSTELLQQIQPLIQSNPELKSQLVNYMTAYNIYIMSMGSIWVMIFYVLFLQFISNNNKQSQIKFLLTVNFVLLAIGLIAFLSIPYIAPDIYLFKLMN